MGVSVVLLARKDSDIVSDGSDKTDYDDLKDFADHDLRI